MSSKYRRSCGYRAKRRHFCGNQSTVFSNSSNGEELVQLKSASAKKLKPSGLYVPEACAESTTNEMCGNRIIDVALVFAELQKLLCCKVCHGEVKMKETVVYGLSSSFTVSCSGCEEKTSFRSSLMIGQRKNVPEMNRRAVYAMRCIGQGLAGLETFCAMMDLPPPVSQKAYDAIVDKIHHASKKVAENSMVKAAVEETELTENKSNSIMVSGDGTWKTRGHTSKIGVCTVIGAESGKVLDTEVLSNFCKACSSSGDTKDHECTKNHDGSSGKMESVGMVRIFKRSLVQRNVRYVKYIGDGDSKTFLDLCSAQPYGTDVELQKVECIGHVQKRMGTRLRKLKAEMRGKKLCDGKSLSGKGRLTDRLIDKLTVYYGNAIRANHSSLEDMRKAVWAVYCHTRSSDDEPLHLFCPRGPDSWCKYQKQVACVGASVVYHHKNTVPAAVMDCIKKVFVALSDPKLLKKCLGGKTQNVNEAFNSTVWKYCPKVCGAGRRIVEVAVHEAVVVFNEGSQGRLQTMGELGIMPTRFCIGGLKKIDRARVHQAEFRKELQTLEARRAKRMNEKERNEKILQQEGPSYGPGQF